MSDLRVRKVILVRFFFSWKARSDRGAGLRSSVATVQAMWRMTVSGQLCRHSRGKRVAAKHVQPDLWAHGKEDRQTLELSYSFFS